MPDSWLQLSYPSQVLGRRSMTTFRPSQNSDVDITLYYRGLPVSRESAASFKRVLRLAPEQKDLTIEEISSLKEIMGARNAGDNQFTSIPVNGETFVPVFNLSSAKLKMLVERPVLAVRGNFQNDSRESGMEFYGIFIDTEGDGTVVQEVMYQAGTKTSFMQHLREFEDTLASVVWR